MDSKIIIDELIRKLQNIALAKKVITLCKDDRIFICSQPYTAKEDG